MPRGLLVASLLAPLSTSALVLDKEVTMYHVNPLKFGPIPVNMDAADVAGDFFFQLFEVLTVPLACEKAQYPKPFECRNLEVVAPDELVNKLTVKVTSNFSSYAMCNIGNANGTDPVGRPCPVGGYCCYCAVEGSGHHHGGRSAPCNATVGSASPAIEFQSFGKFRPCFKDYQCWADRSAFKFNAAHPTQWYSPLAIGDCDRHPAGGPNCTWKVQTVDKIVNATCHADSFFGAVQRAAPEPFVNCTGGGKAAPNATDPCWVRGFYTAVLGPDATKFWRWKSARCAAAACLLALSPLSACPPTPPPSLSLGLSPPAHARLPPARALTCAWPLGVRRGSWRAAPR